MKFHYFYFNEIREKICVIFPCDFYKLGSNQPSTNGNGKFVQVPFLLQTRLLFWFLQTDFIINLLPKLQHVFYIFVGEHFFNRHELEAIQFKG